MQYSVHPLRRFSNDAMDAAWQHGSMATWQHGNIAPSAPSEKTGNLRSKFYVMRRVPAFVFLGIQPTSNGLCAQSRVQKVAVKCSRDGQVKVESGFAPGASPNSISQRVFGTAEVYRKRRKEEDVTEVSETFVGCRPQGDDVPQPDV
jgi:hypothetical protein